MKRKWFISLSLLLSFFSFTAYGLPISTAQPQNCPSPAAIKAVGVSPHAAQQHSLWFTGRSHQKYDTPLTWTFVIGEISATSVDDAYQKATLALDSLSLQIGPVIGPASKWICYYFTTSGYSAFTIYPAL